MVHCILLLTCIAIVLNIDCLTTGVFIAQTWCRLVPFVNYRWTSWSEVDWLKECSDCAKVSRDAMTLCVCDLQVSHCSLYVIVAGFRHKLEHRAS